MDRILELREKRAKAWDTAKNFLDSKRGADGMVSEADAAVYDKMEEDVINLGKEIDRLERQRTIDDELAKVTSSRIVTELPGAGMKKGVASDEYKKAFWDHIRTKTYSREILDSLVIGTDSEGGYLVPDEFEKQIVMALEEESIFRKLATTIKTTSGDRNIPVATGHGQAYWTDEEANYGESDETFGNITIGANKLTTMIKISEELLYDSAFNLESYMSTEFARRMSVREEESFFVGDGSKKPTGIFSDTDGAQTGVTTDSGTAIKADDLIDLFYSLKAPYRKNAVWTMNDTTIKAIRKLKDTTGQYMWQPSISLGQPDTFLGRPVYTSSYVPSIEAGAKTIAFGDFKYYWIADRQTRSVKKLNELFAANGQIGFLGMERVDGKLTLPEAIKVLKMGE